MMMYYSPLLALLVALLLTWFLLISKWGQKIQDIPNARSLHVTPTPRIGGIGLMVGVLAGWMLLFKAMMWWVVLPVLLLFGVSLFDDMRGLSVRWRLLVHVAAAALLVFGSGMMVHSLVFVLIALLGVVWMTNLYNFMDASDGLAGGMTFFGFVMYGVAAWMYGGEVQALFNFSIAAAALGFLCYNFYPAKAFMGDAGSIPLGFLAAAMGLWGWRQGYWPVWFPVLVFSPFVVDATVTLVRRAIRGENVTQAHRDHYCQRLVRLGHGHRNVAFLEYAIMLVVGSSAVWSIRDGRESPWGLWIIWTVIYVVMMWIVDSRWKTNMHR